MGCVFSKQRWGKNRSTRPSDPPKTRECTEDAEILSLTEISGPCEAVSDPHSSHHHVSVPPSRASVERVMSRLMGSQYDFDLTYITDRVISVLFLPDLEEERYSANLKEVAAVLKSKHQEKILLINLSEKRHDICRLNPKVEEFGWPDLHAPALDKICVVCKIMESWLTSDPNNVIVLHCKGLRGKTAVIAAAYLSYSKISAGADEAALRKFCEDEISLSLQPSQNRYIYYFSGLLSGTIKMNSAPLFLHQVHIPVLPSYKSEEGHSPVLKIYQSLQLVYSSSKYDIHDADSKTLCVNIEPALLLKGDVLLKCYDGQMCKRKCVLRVQFHTCAVHGSQLVFGKAELDHACTDDRFPADATVQLLFSSRHQKTSAGLSVDQGITDAAVRWDSYENFNLHHQDSVEDICHTRGPLDGSLYAQVKKRRAPGFSLSSITHHSSSTPPVHLSIQALSVNSSHLAESLSPPPSNVKRQKPEKDEERNTHRETAILDDVDCSSLKRDASIQSCYSRLFSHTHSFCGSDLTNPHTLAQTLQPKHRTLPCIRTAELPARDLCVSQPDLLRERGCCLHQTCSESAGHLYSRPTQEIHTQSPLTHSQSSQSHTLPPQTHTFFSGEACPLFHCSTHPQSHTHIPPSTHQSLLSSPYRELCYISPPPTSCSCRDCSRLREDVALHSLRGRELEVLPWSRKPEFGFRRDGPVHWRDGRVDSHWEGVQEVENLRHKTALSPVMFSFGHCHTVPKHDPTDTQPEHVTPSSSYSSPQSSGYHSPHAPCACSPPPLRESPGYASISHSLNSSPLALTPSPKRANHNDASDEGSRSCLHDGEVMILEVNDKSHVWPFSPLTQDSTASDATDQEYSSAIERETRPTKTPITQSTPNISSLTRPPSCPDQARMSKGAESTVQIHKHKPNPLIEGIQETDQDHQEDSCHTSSSTSTSPQPPICSSERSSASELPSYIVTAEEQRLTPLTDSTSSKEEISSRASPDPDVTPSFPTASYSFPQLTVPHVPYTGYTAVTIPSSLTQPPLPEKQRASPLQNVSDCADTSSLKSDAKLSASSTQFLVSFSSCIGEVPPAALCKTAPSSGVEELESRLTSKFVQDSSKYWYKPGISRDQAIAVLKDQEPGCFLIRDSNSFQGAYGLALKVATAPAHASNHETGSPEEQLVRHFLIESGARGVKIKGCQNETYFGSLSALVYQHSITPVSLPCMLCIPDKDLVGEMQELQSGTNSRTAADLLKLGAACNVLYLNSVETESLTGPQAVSKATKCTLTQEPRPSPTVVHFKVSTQGITLTDNQRRLFFRRHYPVHSVTFSSVDPLDQRWIDADYTSCKMFGFVARRSGGLGNVCHLFAEIDPEQPATAIVNFINKVMLGRQQLRK